MLYVNPINPTLSNTDYASGENAKKKIAGEEMEHLFLYELLKEMRKTTFHSKFLHENSTQEIYNDMLNDALAGEMAKSGQLGIAKQIIQETETIQKRTNNNSVVGLTDVI